MMLSFIRHSAKKAASGRRHVSSTSPPIVEIREYVLQAEFASNYISLAGKTAPLRKSLLPMRLFCVPETGGQLNVATHFYFYEGGIEQRDEARNKALQNEGWKTFLGDSKPFVLTQQSNLYAEAPLVYKHNLCGMRAEIPASPDNDAIYEIRKYRMVLGYDTVPKYLALLEEGLPSKLAAAGNDPSSQLCTVLYTEVGELNNVYEVWRHGGGVKAMNRTRLAAREALPWRSAINNIAKLAIDFRSTLYKPTSFSNWK